MNLTDLLALIRSRHRVKRGKSFYPEYDLLANTLPESEREGLLAASGTDMERLIFGHRGRPVDKPTHYPAIYDRYFGPYRGRPVRMLEIGVSLGGSLEIWRDYFGKDAVIFGIDINPACAERVDAPNQVRIGSQADGDFLRSVVAEMGGIDLVLDDGSHAAPHQAASFKALWPLLAEGGLYAIEDLCTSYWRGDVSGGYRRAGTGLEQIKEMIDDMHQWYHGHDIRRVPASEVLGIHVHDSIAFIEKGRKAPPRSITLG